MDLIKKNFERHFTLLPSLIPEMNVDQQEGLIYSDSGLPCDTFNIAFVHDSEKLASQSLRNIGNHFKSKSFPFCVWAEDDELVNNKLSDAGFEIAAEDITMALRLDQYETKRVVKSGIKIEKIESQGQMMQAADVIAQNWSPPDQYVIEFYDKVASHLDIKNLPTHFFNLIFDDQVVGCVELCPTDENTAGIYGLAVLESYRRKGFGHQLMTHALDFAVQQKLKKVILQASEDGLGLYKRIGFKPVGKFQEWQLV